MTTQPIAITVPAYGSPHYSPRTVAGQPLWQLEGFDSQDVTDLAKGLIQMGKATLDNVIDKIKGAIKKRFPVTIVKQKVLFDEAFQWYKDNDYTYEEAKKELDDNDVDYNEQGLKDARWIS